MLRKLRQWLPSGLRKHYLQPLLRRFGNAETYRRRYDAATFFDQFHGLVNESDDRATISPEAGPAAARFHYNAVENGIIAYLAEHDLKPRSVLDIGSGAGHWLDFYLSVVGCPRVLGVDVSRVAVERLREKFSAQPAVSVHLGSVLGDALAEHELRLDLVNAIGVMFHIVSDEEWRDTILWIHDHLEPGGVFVASGLFGAFTANVQFGAARFTSMEEYEEGDDVACNKRVRSRWFWTRTLRAAGFRSVSFRKSAKARRVHAPENDLVFAVKS